MVTPKDFFSTAIDSLECLWRHTPPAAAVLYVATGPHSSRLGAYVDHCSAAVPGFRVVSCPELCNFYEMRNIAAGLTTTRSIHGCRPPGCHSLGSLYPS